MWPDYSILVEHNSQWPWMTLRSEIKVLLQTPVSLKAPPNLTFCHFILNMGKLISNIYNISRVSVHVMYVYITIAQPLPTVSKLNSEHKNFID